jgi:uncharacterized membrane protein (UPF0127 family)
MDLVDVVIGQVTYRDVAFPTRFAERWRGLRTRHGGMLFRAVSVHGFGMKRPLTVVAIDRNGRVIDVATLRPRRVYFKPAARLLLELEQSLERPEVGAVVALYDRRHGRTARGLRNTHRQPRRCLGTSRRDTANG